MNWERFSFYNGVFCRCVFIKSYYTVTVAMAVHFCSWFMGRGRPEASHARYFTVQAHTVSHSVPCCPILPHGVIEFGRLNKSAHMLPVVLGTVPGWGFSLTQQSGTLCRILPGTRPSVQTVLDVCLKRICSVDTSAFSALEVLDDNCAL